MVADDVSVLCVSEEASGCLTLYAHSGSLILVVQPITIQFILCKPTQSCELMTTLAKTILKYSVGSLFLYRTLGNRLLLKDLPRLCMSNIMML